MRTDAQKFMLSPRSESGNSQTLTPDIFKFLKRRGISGVKFKSSKYVTNRHFCAYIENQAIVLSVFHVTFDCFLHTYIFHLFNLLIISYLKLLIA